jgi:hypothetical protein
MSESSLIPVRPESSDERARLGRAIRAVLGASREDLDVSQKQLAGNSDGRAT